MNNSSTVSVSHPAGISIPGSDKTRSYAPPRVIEHTQSEGRSDAGVGSVPLRAEAARHGASSFTEILWSDLKLSRKLGAGGFGDVYAGMWGGTPIAAKVVRPTMDDDGKPLAYTASQRTAFLREARSLATISHPNCLQLLGVCLQPDNLCIVTEYLKGGDLQTALFESDAVMSDIRKLDVIRQIAQGCEYLHLRKDVVHCDIKPANILLDHNCSVVKVADFGLALVRKSLQQEMWRHAGSLRYMSPEILSGGRSSKEADVYAFGVVMWEILTRQKAFAGVDRQANAFATLPVPDDTPLNSALSALLLRCLGKPAGRPDFGEIVTALHLVQTQLERGQVFPSVPVLPPHYLARKECYDAAKRDLLAVAKAAGADVPHGVCLHGMTGEGKSVLATALARDDDLLLAFPDGAHWVTVGPHPSVPAVRGKLLADMGAEVQAGEDVPPARFAEAISSKPRSLVVFDDVWTAQHLTALVAGLPATTGIVVTTQVSDVTHGAGLRLHVLAGLDQATALEMLARCSGWRVEDLPSCAPALVDACGALPLSVALVGAMLQGRALSSWPDTLRQLQRDGAASTGAEQLSRRGLLASMGVSVKALGPLRHRYLDLAVFTESASGLCGGDAVPPEALAALWRSLPEPLDEQDVAVVVETLEHRSLLRVAPDGHITLHDLQWQFLRAAASARDAVPILLHRLEEGCEESAVKLRFDELQFMQACYCGEGEFVLHEASITALPLYEAAIERVEKGGLVGLIPDLSFSIRMTVSCGAKVEVTCAMGRGYPHRHLPQFSVRSDAFSREAQGAIMQELEGYVEETRQWGELCVMRSVQWVADNAEEFCDKLPPPPITTLDDRIQAQAQAKHPGLRRFDIRFAHRYQKRQAVTPPGRAPSVEETPPLPAPQPRAATPKALPPRPPSLGREPPRPVSLPKETSTPSNSRSSLEHSQSFSSASTPTPTASVASKRTFGGSDRSDKERDRTDRERGGKGDKGDRDRDHKDKADRDRDHKAEREAGDRAVERFGVADPDGDVVYYVSPQLAGPSALLLRREWVFLPMKYLAGIMEALLEDARAGRYTGFICPSEPAVVCIEGEPDHIDFTWQRIRMDVRERYPMRSVRITTALECREPLYDHERKFRDFRRVSRRKKKDKQRWEKWLMSLNLYAKFVAVQKMSS